VAAPNSYALFLGGPHDGEYRETLGDSARICTQVFGADLGGPPVIAVTYRRDTWQCGDTTWSCYVVDDMTPEVAMTRLWTRYALARRVQV
jgi:hypothetical protein